MNNILIAIIKQRKNEIVKDYDVPLHPEFVLTKKVSKHVWEARNSKNKEQVLVKKVDDGGEFCQYEVTILG